MNSINQKKLIIEMKVILICGYRRTGKDTLYQKLTSPDPLGFSWTIYQHPSRTQKVLSKDESYVRSAFADALKLEASVEYNIPAIIPDEDKDLKQFVHPQTQELVSARDIYIEWGSIRRSQDPDYWCKAVFKSLIVDEETSIIVTDWRFHNECRYTIETFENTITCRIYRSDVPEPDAQIESEHQLDSYTTDVLLIRSDDDLEFERAINKFPQYREYIPTGVIA
jgi:hypothetical protein